MTSDVRPQMQHRTESFHCPETSSVLCPVTPPSPLFLSMCVCCFFWQLSSV